jgi:hypothetical protein
MFSCAAERGAVIRSAMTLPAKWWYFRDAVRIAISEKLTTYG